MLKIGSKEIIIMMGMHFSNKVEKCKIVKTRDISSLAFEYGYFREYNNGNDIKAMEMQNDMQMGYFTKDISISLSRLVKKGMLTRIKKGYYELTENGQKEVEKRILINKQLQEMLLKAI